MLLTSHLSVQFNHKETEYNIVISSCYLPPDKYARGRDAQCVLSHSLFQICVDNNCMYMLIEADFNSNIGSLSGILNELDSIQYVIYNSINQNGHDFLEFLNDSKFCVLNGRFIYSHDKFTSESRNGEISLCTARRVSHLHIV